MKFYVDTSLIKTNKVQWLGFFVWILYLILIKKERQWQVEVPKCCGTETHSYTLVVRYLYWFKHPNWL